jgi:serine/threonine protein kinase/tetratricopeptide (TPR) repeat protein
MLDARCAGRPDLRREIESLLSSHDHAGDFLRARTVDAGAIEFADAFSGDTSDRRQDRGRAQPGQIISHYRLVEWVAGGGMGDVYRAEDLALGREAALKLLPRSFSGDLRRILLAEAEASARLQHPAIATFYEAGEADGETFIAMEFVRGPTLRQRLNQGPVPVTEAIAVARCLLEALAHAHAAGLLHRDIKPENVVLVEPTFAKLVDFGIALPIDVKGSALQAPANAVASARDDSTLAGTIGYLAPEQATRGPLDARTDVFQVGVVLYEMLTGRVAFGGRSPLEQLAAAIAGSPELTALDGVEMPGGMRGIVERALAREPGARYETAAVFLRDLAEIDRGRVTLAMPTIVAVAEFANRTGNEHLNWLESALAESVHTSLDGLENTRIIPRSQLARQMSQPAVANDALGAGLRLGCGWLVEGEVWQADDDEMRIVARLVEVATRRVQSTSEIRGPLETLSTLQRDLAAALAGELKGAALPLRTPAGDATAIEVLEYFTRGRAALERFGKGSLEDARELFERSIALDERHVSSLAGLASVHVLRAIARPNAEDYERAVAYADRATAIDPWHLRSWVWKTYALSALGRHRDAELAVAEALAIDPYDTEALYFAGGLELFWKDPPRLQEALTHLLRAVESDDNRGMWWLALGTVHRCLGHHREALYSFTRAERLERVRSRFNTAGAAAYIGETLRRAGRQDEAREAAYAGLEAAEKSDHPYRDTFRAHALTVIGRLALERSDLVPAQAAFQQVLAQARGRPRPRGCGHLVVQALCGMARATGDADWLDEAQRLFEGRDTYNFDQFFGALEGETLFELALAADSLDRHEQAAAWFARARRSGLPSDIP